MAEAGSPRIDPADHLGLEEMEQETKPLHLRLFTLEVSGKLSFKTRESLRTERMSASRPLPSILLCRI